MSLCTICFQTKKHMKQLDCNHIFCHECIERWYYGNTINSKKCPNCRCSFIIKKPNTRGNYFKENQKEICKDLSQMIGVFKSLHTRNEKILYMDKILKKIYMNKSILIYNDSFRKTVINKIQYLKEEGVSHGYYWDQKIYQF